MVFRPVSRSVRRAAGGLVVLAFVAAVAVPVQAAPREATPLTAPGLRILDWVHDALAWLGIDTTEPAATRPEGPQSIFGKASCAEDPNGTTCPESDGTAYYPATQASSSFDRPVV